MVTAPVRLLLPVKAMTPDPDLVMLEAVPVSAPLTATSTSAEVLAMLSVWVPERSRADEMVA